MGIFETDTFSTINFSAPAGTDTTKDDKNLVDKIAVVVDDVENIFGAGIDFLDTIGIDFGSKNTDDVQKDLDRNTSNFLDGFFESDTFSKIKGSIKAEFMPIAIVIVLLLSVVVLKSFNRK